MNTIYAVQVQLTKNGQWSLALFGERMDAEVEVSIKTFILKKHGTDFLSLRKKQAEPRTKGNFAPRYRIAPYIYNLVQSTK